MAAPKSTPNSFLFLELGILPLEHEIAKRQLNFLHHILCLEEDDPVKNVYNVSRRLTHEKNWANTIHETLQKYNLHAEIASLTKDKWKNIVKTKVNDKAFDVLSADCGKGSKTSQLYYDCFKRQQYITSLSPHAARQVFRARSRTIPCKRNQKESFENNLMCRTGCGVEENQHHIINCPNIHGSDAEEITSDFLFSPDFDVDNHRTNISTLVSRIANAKDFVDEHTA